MSFIAQNTIMGICPFCEDHHKIEVGHQIEILHIRGKSIQIDAAVEKCISCKEIFTTTEEDEKNIQEAYCKYRKKVKLLQPKEIAAVRKKYGLSQKLFAKLLGWGEVTLHRYESGALQDEVHNDLLLLLEKPWNFSTIFEKNKYRLPKKQIEKVREGLDKLLEIRSISVTTRSPLTNNPSKWDDFSTRPEPVNLPEKGNNASQELTLLVA